MLVTLLWLLLFSSLVLWLAYTRASLAKATLVLGVLSYVAFRSRERRSPSLAAGAGSAKQFFVRLTLHDEGPTPAQ